MTTLRRILTNLRKTTPRKPKESDGAYALRTAWLAYQWLQTQPLFDCSPESEPDA